MRIKFLRNAEYPQTIPPGEPDAGKQCPVRSKSYKAGEIYDLPDDHARRWLRRLAAVEVTEEEAKKPARGSKVEHMVPDSKL